MSRSKTSTTAARLRARYSLSLSRGEQDLDVLLEAANELEEREHEIEALMDGLRKALRAEWETNHAEHCTNVPHKEGDWCHWAWYESLLGPWPTELGAKPKTANDFDASNLSEPFGHW